MWSGNLFPSCIEPGLYFAMASPAALVGSTPDTVTNTLSTWGFVVTPEMLVQTAKDVGGNTILARAGGAPTLAVGMAHILHQVIGGKAMTASTKGVPSSFRRPVGSRRCRTGCCRSARRSSGARG